MQTQTNINNTVHIKAQHNDEFRRFSLSTIAFASLESLLLKLFNITSDIKVKFLDDENDWILISSDVELQHAIEISTSPIRIQVTLLGATQEKKSEVEAGEQQFGFQRRGCGKGMGRGGCGRGPMVSKEERLAFKTTRITGRIAALEAVLLEPSLTSDRERAITWRLEHMKSKLEKINAMKSTLTTESQSDKTEEEPRRHCRRGQGHGFGPCHEGEIGHVPCGDAPAWGHCGRGRGGKCRRARGENAEAEGHPCGKWSEVPEETRAKFHECKQNMWVARRSGDAEAFKVAQEAFMLAKKEMKEARCSKA